MTEKTGISLVVIFCLLSCFTFTGCNCALGIGGCGPTREFEATITSKHVDSGSKDSGSSYMLATDAGVFEVDNGILLGLWNADELYARLQVGKRYRLTTEGNRVVNFLYQEYPYVTKATEVAPK